MPGRETIPSGEAEAARRVAAISRAMLAAGKDGDHGRPTPRQQHAKHHGVVRAEFVVEPDLPPEYRVGLFREPKAYPAWVRFSNGARADDRVGDAHGMAVKLLGVDGPKLLDGENDATTHDLVMVDNPTFFMPDAAEYVRFSTALLKSRGLAPSLAHSALGFLPDGPRTLLTLLLTYVLPARLRVFAALKKFAGKRLADPLNTQYWSTTPYLFGDGMAMKFSAVPEAFEAWSRDSDAGADDPDYLRAAMARHLASGGARFAFQVQLQVDETRTPIEDPTVEWDESVAPPRTVARIIIPAQEFLSPSQMAFCENLSFTPWRAVPEHRPLGGINRVRKDVYIELSRMRHELNATPSREPAADDPPTGPAPLLSPGPTTFDRVLDAEIDLIRARRRAVEGAEDAEVEDPENDGADSDKRLMTARVEVLDEHVTGLAFSGGGIRAATFAVGVLQGLATLGLLKRFDYLSTVSGGGYAGAWLTAWVKRDGDPGNVELQLDPNRVSQSRADRAYLDKQVVDEEPEPLRHLRAYSSYLAPQGGVLSVDTWTVLLIWARNVTINLMMLLPAAMLVVGSARLFVSLYRLLNPPWQEYDPRLWWPIAPLLAVGASCLAVAFVRNGRALREFRTGDPRDRATFGAGDARSVATNRIALPALAAVIALTLSLRWTLARLSDRLDRPLNDILAPPGGPDAVGFRVSAGGAARLFWDYLRAHLAPGDVPNLVLHAAFFGVFIALGSLGFARRDRAGRAWKFARAGFMAGATGGVLLVLLEGLMAEFSRLGRPDLMATVVPPMALLILVAGLIVEVALLGRSVTEGEREWWARVSALLSLMALGWAAVFATVLYVPGLFLSFGPWARGAIASGWLGTAAFGVLTGRYVLPKVGGRGFAATASAASLAFLVGLLGAVALLGAAFLNVPPLSSPRGGSTPFAFYLEGLIGADWPAAVGLLVVSGLLFRVSRRLIDVNLFSLHAMYVNRLTRAYLGASRAMANWPRRWGLPRDPREDAGAPSLGSPADAPPPVPRDPNPVTQFDPRDDLDLIDLRVGAKDGPTGRPYLGPHWIINTMLNLVGGDDLAVRDRKGESFTLSPLYCGSKSVGYSRADATRDRLTVGGAVAISGAAIDPNMSFYQSGPLTALLTIFNARLGYWMEKPKAGWQANSPKFGDLFFTEFFGRTRSNGDYVHLSDGGHFENLGVYELIRRRCRYIVAVDAASDGDPSDDSLSALIRLCRIDFGVRIKIDTEPLRMTGPEGLTRTHAVVGAIHYDDVDQGEMPGVLVYLKSSMTGDEPPDLQKYAREDPAFPLQPTDFRQSFTEEQFECYRSLGDHIARDVFEDAMTAARGQFDPGEVPRHRDFVPRLFSAVQQRWAEAPKAGDEATRQTARAWTDLLRDLGTLPELADLSRDLYPELPPAPGGPRGVNPADRARAELLAVSRMLVIVEEAWQALGLKRYAGLPMNRGWMNAFRRWTVTRAFRDAWPALRSEQNADFVRFCEDQLHAATALSVRQRLAKGLADLAPDGFEGRAVAEIADEFAREWPDEAKAGRGVRELIARASALGLAECPVWLIVQPPVGPDRVGEPTRKVAAGIIIASEFADHPDASLTAGKPPFELTVWVRPPYRLSGLGSRAARGAITHVVDELRDARGGTTPTLWARYPDSHPGDDDRDLMLWLRFHARYDFRRRYPKLPPGVPPVTLLERKVKG